MVLSLFPLSCSLWGDVGAAVLLEVLPVRRAGGAARVLS